MPTQILESRQLLYASELPLFWLTLTLHRITSVNLIVPFPEMPIYEYALGEETTFSTSRCLRAELNLSRVLERSNDSSGPLHP